MEHLCNQIGWMLSDMKPHLKRSEEAKENATQIRVGISNLFTGWIVKNWINVQDVQTIKLSTLCKIIVRQSALFCAEACRHRNKVLHDPFKCKNLLIVWHENIIDLIDRDDRPGQNNIYVHKDQCRSM